jgi:hypothetical protein
MSLALLEGLERIGDFHGYSPENRRQRNEIALKEQEKQTLTDIGSAIGLELFTIFPAFSPLKNPNRILTLDS